MIEYVDREGSNCFKWDSTCAKGTLPLWVADMDFKAAQPIIDALQERLNHGVFGYNQVPQDYYDTVSNWFKTRHQWNTISQANLIYTIGVVPAISAILYAMKRDATRVLIFTPAYNCFFSSIRNINCELIESPLLCINNHFEIDWEDFERKISGVDIFLLCNPHNPTGRVWTPEELVRIAQLCHKHGVFVISDEIHCDIVFPQNHYTPYAVISHNDYFCSCVSASKAFNIAGLQCANIFAPNPDIYARIDKAINVFEICDVNPMGMVAQMAAFGKGADWLDELNAFIFSQYTFLCDFIVRNMPEIKVTRMEGTYLTWLNISHYLNETITDSTIFCQQLAATEHVLFNSSEMYGGHNYIRINMATSRDNLSLALQKMLHFVKNN